MTPSSTSSTSLAPAPVNPYAPATYNGIIPDTPPGYVDVAFDYVYNVILTANLSLPDSLPIENDADFVWRGIVLANVTGPFQVQFSDSQWYQLSNAQVNYQNYTSNAANPSPVWPELTIAAGGRIGVFITDLSAAQNTIQIVFKGVKRFAVPQS